MRRMAGHDSMRSTAQLWWWLLMIAGGFGFGLLADRRPFGESVLGHPVVVFVGLAGLGLIILRIALRRPVPELIPERALMIGFAVGIAAFLVGNWVGVHLIAWR